MLKASTYELFDVLRAHPGASYDDLAALTGRPRDQVMAIIMRARSAGWVDSDRVRKEARHWLVSDPPVSAPQQILRALRTGPMTRFELRARLRSLRRSTIDSYLLTLERADCIEVLSSTRPFKYTLKEHAHGQEEVPANR